MARFSATKMNPTRYSIKQWPFYAILVPVCIFMLLPLVYIFNTAFKPFDELIAYPPRFLVQNPTFENFVELFKQTSTTQIPISRYLFNSIIVTISVLGLSILISSMAGFALSKLNFHIKNIIFEINTVALMFVGVAVGIPRYLVIEKLGLIDNFLVHIIPGLALPVGLFLIKQFIDQIPKDLIEAAKLDGANDLKVYFKVILPLIKPALATVAILCFQAVWNDAGTSNLYINTESLRTFAFYMSTLSSSSNAVAGQSLQAVSTLIMFIPNLIIFIVLQSKVMSTMAHSGIK
jgi:ABC-type glycerol-3-phosphate transport system permease component